MMSDVTDIDTTDRPPRDDGPAGNRLDNAVRVPPFRGSRHSGRLLLPAVNEYPVFTRAIVSHHPQAKYFTM